MRPAYRRQAWQKSFFCSGVPHLLQRVVDEGVLDVNHHACGSIDTRELLDGQNRLKE